MLNTIGVLELLEQDERPTFIVDLADQANDDVGILRPVFANQSLRSQAGLDLLVTGQASSETASPGSQSFAQFKAWILTATVEGESLSVCLPPFIYSNVSWSCSTLRKRLRIISGTALTTLLGARDPARRSSLEPVRTAPPQLEQEPTDYFGPSTAVSGSIATSDESSSGQRTIVPTIEQSNGTTAGQSTLRPDIHMSDVLAGHRKDLSEATELLPSHFTYVSSSQKGAIEGSSRASSVDGDSSHIPIVAADSPSFDWTRLPVTDNMPAHIRFARSVDWASTSLGPIENWSSDLRQMCNLIMASPHPAAM